MNALFASLILVGITVFVAVTVYVWFTEPEPEEGVVYPILPMKSSGCGHDIVFPITSFLEWSDLSITVTGAEQWTVDAGGVGVVDGNWSAADLNVTGRIRGGDRIHVAILGASPGLVIVTDETRGRLVALKDVPPVSDANLHACTVEAGEESESVTSFTIHDDGGVENHCSGAVHIRIVGTDIPYGSPPIPVVMHFTEDGGTTLAPAFESANVAAGMVEQHVVAVLVAFPVEDCVGAVVVT